MTNRSPRAGSPEAGAAAWLARLQAPDCTAAERAEFERWRAAHRQNAIAFAQAERLYRRSAELASDPLLKAAAQQARRDAAADRDRERRRHRWRPSLAAAALLLLATGIGIWHFGARQQVPVQHYATGVGEQRGLRLQDGSELLLDTDSAVDVRFDEDGREVVLKRGRIQLSVADEVRRPFLVRAGNGVIRDVGTRFHVRHVGDDVTVTLIDGIVMVSVPAAEGRPYRESTLTAGERVSFDSHGGLGPVVAIDPGMAERWTRGDLVFRDRPLGDLLDEMNRYSETKIRLGDPALQTLAVSGTFHAGDQASLVRALQVGWSLRAEHVSPHEVVLRPGG